MFRAPLFLSVTTLIAAIAATASAAATPASLYEKARASLVIVRYTWNSELGPREVEAPGVVINSSGLVMCTAAMVNDAVPLKQMQYVKVIVPRVDNEPLELAANFQGRDDRCDLAFFKVPSPHVWTPISFSPAQPTPGEPVISVGLLGRSAGYRPVVSQAIVSATLDEGPKAMVDGGLPGYGAIIFDADGNAIGYASAPVQSGGRAPAQQPSLFSPSVSFLSELRVPPTPEKPVVTPWMGVADWNGLTLEEAAYYGITTPAIHIGGVAKGGPLARAGINAGQIIVGCNGKPLQRSESTDSITTLLRQHIVQMMPGDAVQFDVVDAKGASPKPVSVTLDPVPPLANSADRFWSEELGLGVRDMVFLDRFARRLPADAPGVLVTLVRPGSPAEAAHVASELLVKELGGSAVKNASDFAAALHKQRQDSHGEPVVLLVNQNGRDATVRIELN